MAMLIDVLSWVCLSVGGFLGITGAVGLLRFPDFYTRIHAASVTDTLCAGLIIFGLMLQGGFGLVLLKLLMLLLILAYTGPTAVHALVKAARQEGLPAVLAQQGDKPSTL